MSAARRIAAAIIGLAAALLPDDQRKWGRAMRHEVESIARGDRAMLFALGCLGFALRQALETRAARQGEKAMTIIDTLVRRPRLTVMLCGVAATGLGLAHMAVAVAPARYLAMNAAALLIGLLVAGGALLYGRAARSGMVYLVLASILLAASLAGTPVDGAARWIAVGGLSIQLSLILLPIIAIGFAARSDAAATTAIAVAALALAFQPDRAMAGALAAGMAAVALVRRERNVMIALAASACGFAVTLLRPDVLPAMPFVDGILYSAFAVHPLAGAAVWMGIALMILPAIIGWNDRDHRAVHAVFGAVWVAIILAAALGNYPTPLVGYGGSAIIGYLLGVLALPGHAAAAPAGGRDAPAESERGDPTGSLRAAAGL